jgi:hypothetical protein
MKPAVKFVLALWCALFLIAGQAHADTAVTETRWRYTNCRYGTLYGGSGFNTREVKRTIRCAVDHWNVPGGESMALCIANRESGFRPHADNPSSSAAGVYQMLDSTWNSWRHGSLSKFANRWNLSRSVYHARANVLIGVKAMSRWGLTPWAGGC